MAFFKLPSNMMKLLHILYILTIVRWTAADNDIDTKQREPSEHARDIFLVDPEPLSLSLVSNSSEEDGNSEINENIRHQRQIRFKSSYQELPKSLQNPIQDSGANSETSPEYSYFVQVDVDDPPPSTALTTLPEGVKVYFPPQVSGVVPLGKPSVIQERKDGRKKVHSTSEGPKFHPITQGKDISASLSPSPTNLLTSSYSSIEDHDIVNNSPSKSVTSSNSINVLGSQMTVPRQNKPVAGLPAQNDLQNLITSDTETSSYLSYEQENELKNTHITQKRISTSRPPFVKISTTTSFKSNGPSGKLFPKPSSSFATASPSHSITSSPHTSFASHKKPSLFGSTVAPTTTASTRFPKTLSSFSTSSYSDISSSSSHGKQSSKKHKQTTAFHTSPTRHLGTNPQPSKSFSSLLPNTKNPPQRKPLPKSQSPQFQSSFKFPSPSSSLSITSTGASGIKKPGFPVPSKPLNTQTHFGSSTGPTSFPISNGKSLLNRSPNVLQAKKEFKHTNNGILSQAPQRDGKTRALVNSDIINTSNPPSSGPDSPTLRTIPKTGFECASKDFGGYYADPETDCQVFHMCWGRRSASFLCPEGTLFNQQLLVCDWAYNVDCSSSVASFGESGNVFEYWGRNQV